MKGIRRLADHLDISIGTVSRALNGKPDVNEATRKRVLEAAATLGYVANQSRPLAAQGHHRHHRLHDRDRHQDLPSTVTPSSCRCSTACRRCWPRHQLDLVALLCGSGEDPHAYLRRVVGRGFVDGLIISATQRHDPRIDLLADRHIPFIALGRSLTDRGHPWWDLDFEQLAEGRRRPAGTGAATAASPSPPMPTGSI